MATFESKRQSSRAESPTAPDLEDYRDAPYYSLLARLPQALVAKHLSHIEQESLDDAAGMAYVTEVMAKRTEALTVTVISDEKLKEVFDADPSILTRIETTVFTDTTNYLGEGQTARVKRLELPLPDGTVQHIAVKYVITPTAKTLTAAGEHDVILEAELLTSIEHTEEELHVDTKLIKVPHPYFHHTTEKIQSYGMECVDGVTLEDMFEDRVDDDFKEALQKSPFCTASIQTFFAEVDKFWSAVHQHSLHGDIKPKNFMINREGTLYVIDFGQAVFARDVSDKAQDAFLNLKEDEVKATKQTIRYLRRRLGASTD